MEVNKKEKNIKCHQFGLWCNNTKKDVPFIGVLCRPCFEKAHQIKIKTEVKTDGKE